jgi:hypothetical protein
MLRLGQRAGQIGENAVRAAAWEHAATMQLTDRMIHAERSRIGLVKERIVEADQAVCALRGSGRGVLAIVASDAKPFSS